MLATQVLQVWVLPPSTQALCGQLVRCLSPHHTVDGCVLAANGLDLPGLLILLQDARCDRFDVVVLSMGAHDATDLCAPLHWARWQTRLAELIDLRTAPALRIHSAVHPMHACLAPPQPLRWFMERWAGRMNHSLAELLVEQVGRIGAAQAPCRGMVVPGATTAAAAGRETPCAFLLSTAA